MISVDRYSVLGNFIYVSEGFFFWAICDGAVSMNASPQYFFFTFIVIIIKGSTCPLFTPHIRVETVCVLGRPLSPQTTRGPFLLLTTTLQVKGDILNE